MRLEPTAYPPEIHWDSLSWSWRWDCILPGCRAGGTGFAGRDAARVEGNTHADEHGRGTW